MEKVSNQTIELHLDRCHHYRNSSFGTTISTRSLTDCDDNDNDSDSVYSATTTDNKCLLEQIELKLDKIVLNNLSRYCSNCNSFIVCSNKQITTINCYDNYLIFYSCKRNLLFYSFSHCHINFQFCKMGSTKYSYLLRLQNPHLQRHLQSLLTMSSSSNYIIINCLFGVIVIPTIAITIIIIINRTPISVPIGTPVTSANVLIYRKTFDSQIVALENLLLFIMLTAYLPRSYHHIFSHKNQNQKNNGNKSVWEILFLDKKSCCSSSTSSFPCSRCSCYFKNVPKIAIYHSQSKMTNEKTSMEKPEQIDIDDYSLSSCRGRKSVAGGSTITKFPNKNKSILIDNFNNVHTIINSKLVTNTCHRQKSKVCFSNKNEKFSSICPTTTTRSVPSIFSINSTGKSQSFNFVQRIFLFQLLMTCCLVVSVVTLPAVNSSGSSIVISSTVKSSSSSLLSNHFLSESQLSPSIDSSPSQLKSSFAVAQSAVLPVALSQQDKPDFDRETYYYLKPSEFFNRYFSCRYNLKNSHISSFSSSSSSNLFEDTSNRPDADDAIEYNEEFADSNYDSELSTQFPKSATSAPSSFLLSSNDKRSLVVKNATLRHAKRQRVVTSQTSRRSASSCPIDCDGISKWPETQPNTVQLIPCLDVLKYIRQKPPAIPNHKVVDYKVISDLNDDGENDDQTMISIADRNIPQKSKVAASRRRASGITPLIEDYLHNEEKLSKAMASRRCSAEGSWQPQADYSTCGLESARLFVLNQQQLRKIYDIREKMVSSKYTKTYRSELEFINCVDNVLSKPPSRIPKPFCERTFDGWTCFNDTPAGHISYFKCPDFIYGFNYQNEAHKTCTSEGKWKVHKDTLQPWTNYTSCVDIPDFHFRNMIINLHIIGYSISLVALLISLTIFFAFKTLSSQTRIRIHKNFFASFIINNFMWIIWYFAITDQNMLFENSLYCQSLHVILHYFLVCNYFWMFCEGLYLHTILVVAFVSEEKILKWFYLIGWGIPASFAACYAILRANSPDAHNCWIDESKYTWILNVPVCISFFLNIIFLINIVRVLVTKLQAVNTVDTHQTRKAVRATLILIPLLGLHFILTPFRPENNSSAAHAYEVFSAIVSSLQGFCVSMLFCFFNGEVLTHIRKRWNQFLLVHGYGSNRRMSYGGTTVSCCLFSFVSEPHHSSEHNSHHYRPKHHTTLASGETLPTDGIFRSTNKFQNSQSINSIRDKSNFFGSLFENCLSYCLPWFFSGTVGKANVKIVQEKRCLNVENDNNEDDNNNEQESEHLSLCMESAAAVNEQKDYDETLDHISEQQLSTNGLNNTKNNGTTITA